MGQGIFNTCGNFHTFFEITSSESRAERYRKILVHEVAYGVIGIMGGLLKAIPNWLARSVRWLRAALLHPLDALYDHIRFLRHSNSLFRRTGERQRLESLLTYYYHKVEKALAMPEVKPIFGLGYIDRLLELFEELGREPEGAQTVPFYAAHHALVRYREKVAPSLQRTRPKLLRRINDVLAAHPVPARGFVRGGAESVNAQDLQPAQAWEHFVTLVRSRRSVRNFSPNTRTC
jgi:hypothetical protein